MQLGFIFLNWAFHFIGLGIIVYYIRFWRQSEMLSKTLKTEIAFFEKDLNKSNLVTSFPTIEKRMQENENLGKVWNEFDASLVKNGQFVSTTVEADVYFNEYILVDVPLKLEIVRNIPGSLTGLGIIGTFIGVLAGLNGYDSHNVEAVRSSVSNLLTGVQGAFWNSFIAISLAVLVTAIEKYQVSKLYRQVTHLQQAINRLFNRSISDDYLQRMLVQMEEQSQAMKSFSQDLSESIKVSLDELVNKQSQSMQVANQYLATTISTTLKEELRPSMDKLSHVMEEVRTTQADAGQDTMKKMVSEFKQSLSSSSNTQMEQMLEVLSGTTQTLGSLKNEMDHFISAMSAQGNMQQEMVSQQISTMNQQSVESQMQMRREFTTFADSVAQNIGQVQKEMATQSSQSVQLVADQLTGLVGKTQQQSEVKIQLFEDMLISIKNETNHQMVDNTSRLTAVVTDTVEKMGTETEKLLANNAQMNQQLMGRVDMMVEQLDGLANKTANNSEELANTLRAGAESMKNLFVQAHNLSADYGKILVASKEVSSGLTGSLVELNKASGGIKTSADSYQQVQSSVLKHVDSFNNQLRMSEEGYKKFEHLYTLYRESGAQVEKVVEGNKNLIQSLDASVTEGLDNYIKLTQQSISGYLTQLDKSLSVTVNKLATSTSGLEESLDEFSDTMESLLKSKKVG